MSFMTLTGVTGLTEVTGITLYPLLAYKCP